MSYRITFVTDLFKGGEEQALSHEVLAILLNALYLSDCAILRARPNIPRLYDTATGVRYQREPRGQEDWKDIPSIIRDHHGDCEDLACWRAAELTVRD